HSGAGWPYWLSLVRRTSRAAPRSFGPGRLGHSRVRSLFDHPDLGHGSAPDPSCSRNGQAYPPQRGKAARMAGAGGGLGGRSQGKKKNRKKKAGTGRKAKRKKKKKGASCCVRGRQKMARGSNKKTRRAG